MEKVSLKFFHVIKFPGKIFMFLKNWGQPGVLHIITFHSSRYWLRYAWSKFSTHAYVFIFHSVKSKSSPYISQSIIRAVKNDNMENNWAHLTISINVFARNLIKWKKLSETFSILSFPGLHHIFPLSWDERELEEWN